MLALSPWPTDRELPANSTAVDAAGLVLFAAPRYAESASTEEDAAIRPFRIGISEGALVDLRQRIAAAEWPAVLDHPQGAQLAKVQGLVRYWETEYDWRKAEAKLNAAPLFVTEIDGLDIHFLHVRSRHANALPLLITHGWPGSILELAKVIGPLTEPTAHAGRPEDAFDVVLPSVCFSARPQCAGCGPDRIACAWDVLMKRLGYQNYVSQGSDWGSTVAEAMARQAPAGLLGIHVNVLTTAPADVARAWDHGGPIRTRQDDGERATRGCLNNFGEFGGSAAFGAPCLQPLCGLEDSPAGLAVRMFDKLAASTYNGGDPQRFLTKDELLDNITLYWLTNTAISSYGERNNNFHTVEHTPTQISIPAAVTVFAGEVHRAQRCWAERVYPKLIYFRAVGKGGHFTAWEQPELLAQELRAAFKSLRSP